MSPDAARPQRGFTLLEIMVALAIAGLALAALFDGAGVGLRSMQRTGRLTEALSHARSHFAAMQRAGPLIPGDQEGDDGGGFTWHRHVVALGAVRGEQGGGLLLFDITLTLRWREGEEPRGLALTSRIVTRTP